MNDSRHDRDALLAAAFEDDWVDGRSAAFAAAAARTARRRHRTRQAMYGAAVAGLVAICALVTWRQPPLSRAPIVTTAAPASVATASRGYVVISDDELLAQLRDRPLLVVKKDDGAHEIMLLDE